MIQNFPSIDMIKTGQNITKMRISAGLSVKDMQQIFGFSTPNAIYKWQKGQAMPTLDNIAVLAVLFGVRIDDILVMDDAMAAVIRFSELSHDTFVLKRTPEQDDHLL